MFNDAVQVQYLFKAGKPGKAGYEQAMKKLGCNTGNTLFVGDQLFTDVWGARRCRISSILVQPIARHEKIVLASYKRTCRKQGRIFLYKEDKDAD